MDQSRGNVVVPSNHRVDILPSLLRTASALGVVALALLPWLAVAGDVVTHHVDISWNQSWTGTDLVRFYKLNDNILTITTAPVQDAIDGTEGKFILVWERVQ